MLVVVFTILVVVMRVGAISTDKNQDVLDAAKTSLRVSPCAKLHFCSGHGRCDEKECSCYRGYGGTTCNEKSMEGCPGDCSGVGFCKENENGELKCLCEVGFSGEDCSVHHCVDGCSGNGVCTPSGCECNFGFVGRACEKKTCPNDCSFNGFCNDGKCECKDSYSGDDCSISRCPNQCNGHGNCVDGAHCDCFNGYAGDACETKLCASGLACSTWISSRLAQNYNFLIF